MRVRQAANLALDRKTINEALTLGYSQDHQQHHSRTVRILLAAAASRSTIRRRPSSCWRRRAIPNGFDAGRYYCDASYANVGEAVLDNLRAVGIRGKLRPLERAAFFEGYAEQEVQRHHPGRQRRFRQRRDASGGFVVKGGAYVYGSYPDIDALFQQQAAELDHKQARGDPAQNAAARPKGDICADLAAGASSTASGRGSGSRRSA